MSGALSPRACGFKSPDVGSPRSAFILDTSQRSLRSEDATRVAVASSLGSRSLEADSLVSSVKAPRGAAGDASPRPGAWQLVRERVKVNSLDTSPIPVRGRQNGSPSETPLSPKQRDRSPPPPTSPMSKTRSENTSASWGSPRSSSLTCGRHTIAGYKQMFPAWKNQDTSLLKELSTGHFLAAVFDGHGEHGHLVSNQAKDYFSQNASILDSTDLPSAFARLFRQCNAKILANNVCEYSGSTASCALVDPKTRTVVFAHVGDSSMVLYDGGQVVFTTKDHKFGPEEERHIAKSGGQVRFFSGSKRIFSRGSDFPGLAMSRALGDRQATRVGLSSEPDVSPILHLGRGGMIVLASDGLWDVMPPTAVGFQADAAGDAQRAACTLATSARSRWPTLMGCLGGDIDDITVAVVKM
uniref:PPM-type phosphatase domain-containing protein n=1 Tax=Noctiluca scintillans TaxID=2966 RepID=A0A7S0ZVC6_NOCSC